MADEQLSFKISTGLKNIIGRDLITDDYVAVFELVKNSFDAYAKKVTITFKGDKIIIADDGKGMDFNDINNKWLFVAYSAKKEGVEDAELEEKEFKNYRDQIQSKKFFAGAKGIGRFSCDRLGSKLTLTTKNAAPNSKIEQIEVNWNDFDQDPEEKFIDIKVKHRTIAPITKELKNLGHGTILEISQLNSNWDRKKKLDLKYSLEKLINPFEDNPLNGFSIYIEDQTEKEADKGEDDNRNKVNGEVKNFVFETLGLKTTQITSEIDAKGEYITTTLWDRDTLIYKIRRRNNTNPKLENINIRLFHLNRSAKNNFTRLMGIAPWLFGSVFVYKNGFRVPPYGDFGIDYFGLDSRKAQKHFEKFGTRDLIGRIEIIGNNPNLREASSRDGGLVRNEHYQTLIRFFINNTLAKLEDYAINVLFTNKDDKDRDDLSALNNIIAKSALLNLISDEINEEETELLDVDKDNLNIRAQELLSTASESDIEALKSIADKLGDKGFEKEAERIGKAHEKVIELQNKLAEEEEARRQAEERERKANEELEEKTSENLFLKSIKSQDLDHVVNLMHHIGISSGIIESYTKGMIYRIENNIDLSKEEMKSVFLNINSENQKILSISRFSTKANFKINALTNYLDLAKFIQEYILNISQPFNVDEIKFSVENSVTKGYFMNFRPLEITLLIDNIISNSKKAGAKKINIALKEIDNQLEIIFNDNGKGIDKDKFQKIFDYGYTTTNGSGLGLTHIKEIIEKMGGTIESNPEINKGAEFIIKIKKS